MSASTVESWDIFISHASEDKADFVEPLASALSAFGVNVWYDKYALKLGDSLSRSIDLGLAKSNFGLIVISPSFIAKKWPEYELRGLNAREIAGTKVILPVWHNVSRDDVLNFSPTLADKLAVDSSGKTPVQIAIRIIEVIRPDLFTQIQRRIAYHLSLQDAKVNSIALSKLYPSPIQHNELPPELVGRIRLVRACLLGAYTHSMDFWMDGFKRDAHPSNEIAYWEHIAAVYREYTSMVPVILTTKQHERLFQVILSMSITSKVSEIEQLAKDLPDGALEILTELYVRPEPIYDIEEVFPFSDQENHSEVFLEKLKEMDKEHFPEDLPEKLIRELMVTKPIDDHHDT